MSHDLFFTDPLVAQKYSSIKIKTRLLDKSAAEILNRKVQGTVLAVGGIWEFFEWGSHLKELVVVDKSRSMLQSYAPQESRPILGDLYSLEFTANRFDTVVFPLMLHHTALGTWRNCEKRIEEALARTHQWLKPGGQVYIVEYCPHIIWYWLEWLLLPLMRLFFTIIGQSLVVMHPGSFFERVLRDRFVSLETSRIIPPDMNNWSWLPVFLAAPWIKLPFIICPKMYVFMARKNAPGLTHSF
jgi:SAM-dependent methyltransferase